MVSVSVCPLSIHHLWTNNDYPVDKQFYPGVTSSSTAGQLNLRCHCLYHTRMFYYSWSIISFDCRKITVCLLQWLQKKKMVWVSRGKDDQIMAWITVGKIAAKLKKKQQQRDHGTCWRIIQTSAELALERQNCFWIFKTCNILVGYILSVLIFGQSEPVKEYQKWQSS